MTTTLATRWHPLGSGRQSPPGALRDARLSERIAAYKRDIAGAYRNLPPDDLGTILLSGPCWVSPKVDGMTTYLYRRDGVTVVLTPTGQVLAELPLTIEADQLLGEWTGLLAGELYAVSEQGRPTIYGLLSALGGGAAAPIDRLRFAAFDILQDGDGDRVTDAQALPLEGRSLGEVSYAQRAQRLQSLLANGTLAHAVPVTAAHTLEDVLACYQREVVERGGEGLVIHAGDGRIYKVKPVITLDAVVVGYTATDAGISDLLLGLLPPDQPDEGMSVQLIGRVDVGFTAEERKLLAVRLATLQQPAALVLTSRAGRPYQWVKPQLVVEVRCHELLVGDQEGLPIRRWQMAYAKTDGWMPLGKLPSVSLRDAVFERVRDDKAVTPQAVRWSQLTDLVAVPALPPSPVDMPPAEIIRRAVYTKSLRGGGMAIRKVVVLEHQLATDAGYPLYSIYLTDYSPERQEPLRTTLMVAGTVEQAQSIANNWLAEHTGRGWQCVSEVGKPADAEVVIGPGSPRMDTHTLTVACARSTSPTFPIVRKRLTALAELGALTVTTNEQGKEVWFELTVADLVPSYRRIANLLTLVRRWKTCEISLDGETLDKFAVDDVLNRLEEIRRCWQRRQGRGMAGCRQSCALGCDQLALVPSQRYLQAAATREPEWYTVGRFDGQQVIVDKVQLQVQVDRRRNRLVACCPHFDRRAVGAAITALPDTLTPDETQWQLAYHRDDGRPAWVLPVQVPLPPRLSVRGIANAIPPDGRDVGITLERGTGSPQCVTPARQIPTARYADVCGQDEAVAAVRELIELPMQHTAYFAALGATPRPGGVILAGPPGTGKTLLARAVAAECGAHLEVIAGPEILSQWVGGSEQALRDIFTRAQQFAPSLILIDELDSIAPSRSRADAQHQQSLVAQLLVLLDGLESRKGVSLLATTNRPKAVDPALRRPGRFDRIVWMRPPDVTGRAAILRHNLVPLRLADDIDREALIADIAVATDGATGADLAYLCQSAARRCVQEAVQAGISAATVAITHPHLQQSLHTWLDNRAPSRH